MIAFVPICTCKNNWWIWRHNASTPHSRDVTDQLWWYHNAKSEKTVDVRNKIKHSLPWITIFSCDQAALQMAFSVCLSVRPSVRLSVTPFWLCSHHRILMKFSGVITNDQCKVHAKGQGQRSKVKVTEVTTQLNRFRTVTPVWIHIWWWNDAYSLMLLRRGAYCFSRSSVKFQGHTALKIVEFDLDWAFPDCNSSLNSPMATKWCTKLEVA